MNHLVELLKSLDKNSVLDKNTAKLLSRGQNPLAEPHFVKIWPAMPKIRKFRKFSFAAKKTASQNPKLGEKP